MQAVMWAILLTMQLSPHRGSHHIHKAFLTKNISALFINKVRACEEPVYLTSLQQVL